jgi:hypothetical protein
MTAPTDTKAPNKILSGKGASMAANMNPARAADMIEIHKTIFDRFLPKKLLILARSINTTRMKFKTGASILYLPHRPHLLPNISGGGSSRSTLALSKGMAPPSN